MADGNWFGQTKRRTTEKQLAFEHAAKLHCIKRSWGFRSEATERAI